MISDAPHGLTICKILIYPQNLQIPFAVRMDLLPFTYKGCLYEKTDGLPPAFLFAIPLTSHLYGYSSSRFASYLTASTFAYISRPHNNYLFPILIPLLERFPITLPLSEPTGPSSNYPIHLPCQGDSSRHARPVPHPGQQSAPPHSPLR